MSRSGSRIALAAAGGVLVLVLVVVLLSRGSSGDGAAAPGPASGTSTSFVAPPSGPVTASTAPGPDAPTTEVPMVDATPTTVAGPAPSLGPRPPAADAPIPLAVQVSSTQGLRDGQTVSVTVTPEGGSQVFGFEAFLCKGGVDFRLDADIRPDETGKCVAHPVSASSDDYKLVQAEPPYQSVTADFRVGVGTDQFQLRDGRAVQITCGPGNPCQLVLKLQYPDAYGFRAFPLTFG